MSDRRKEAEEKMAKAIFISADCWLCVFDLLPAYQLGLEIALINRRFDFYVDEHFKTRRWALRSMEIKSKFEADGTMGMDIFNFNGKQLPIPQKMLPKKVVGFERISISFIDQNVIAFLHRLSPLFASCPVNLAFGTNNECILALILNKIWQTLGKNIHGIESYASFLHRLRQSVPSLLNDCPALRFVSLYYDGFFAEFPADDSAMASEGQAMATLQNDVPKVLICTLDADDGNSASRIEAFKAAFASASSPVCFIVVIWVFPSSFAAPIVPFVLTNELTREQLALKETEKSDDCFVLVRCPIVRDASKWTKWEEEAIGWECFDQSNKIVFNVDEIGDGLLDAMPGPSDQQQK